MKKKWMKRGSAAALAAVVCLNGCGMRAGQEMENGGYKSQTNVKEPEAIAFDDVEGRIARREENQVPESFLEAVRQFSWGSAALLLEETEENRNYSPLSLYYALALAAQGASGTTEQEFLDLLGVGDREELAEACGKLYRLLYTDNEIGQLKLADSLWMSGKSKFKKDFIQKAQDDFYSDLFLVDFGDEETGKAMGEWIVEHTNGTLAPQIATSEEDALAVLNTVYLYDEWSSRFGEEQNTEGAFTTLSGEESDVTYMNQEFDFLPWLIGDGYTGTSLGLKNGGSMVLILPEEGTDIRELLTAEKLEEMFGDTQGEIGKVNLSLPKFTFGDSMELIPALREMGMESAFGDEADFSNMTDEDILISQIRQETHIGLEEEGVEASAYTELMLAGTSMPAEEEALQLCFDRPFLYGILDSTGVPLFLGLCGNPDDAGAAEPGEGTQREDTSEPGTSDIAGGSAGLPEHTGGAKEVDFGCAGSARPSGGEFRFSLAEGHENEVWYYDEFFSIEQYADGAWGPLPVQGGFCGVTSYWKIGEDPETDCLNIVWDSIYETLQPGIYCVSKEVFPEGAEGGPDLENGKQVYAVFEIEDPMGLSLEIRDVTPTGLTMQFARKGGNPTGELEYGKEYWLERLEDGRWVRLDGDMNWEAVAFLIGENGGEKEEVNWERYYGTLPEGKYRFCKEVTDYRGAGDYDTYVYKAEFEIGI